MAIANNKTNILTNQELSIQISLNGLSFCILQKDTNTISYINHVENKLEQTPNRLLEILKKVLETNTSLQKNFTSIQVIYVNALATLVPKALFNEAHLADYLKYNTKILKTDFIAFDTISINQSVNIYVPYMNINNYLFEQFGTFNYKHYATILIEEILQLEKHSEEEKIYIHVTKNHFEIMVTNQGKLILYNRFDYYSKEDFIYYILFTAEQLQLNPETVKLVFLGDILETDALYEIAYKYIRNIEFAVPKTKYKFKEQPEVKHTNFIITNSF